MQPATRYCPPPSKKWQRCRSGANSKAAAYQTARRAEILKIPVSQPNLNALQEQFLLSIKEIKRNMVAETVSLKIDLAALLTKQTAEELYARLRKGQDSLRQDDQRPLSCFVADPYQQDPERIYLRKETIREVRAAMQKSGDRLRTWLFFRFGFIDDKEHSVAEKARHFHLSVSRGKATDKTALQTVRRYYLKQ